MQVSGETELVIRLSPEAAQLIKRYAKKFNVSESELASALLHEHLEDIVTAAFVHAAREVWHEVWDASDARMS